MNIRQCDSDIFVTPCVAMQWLFVACWMHLLQGSSTTSGLPLSLCGALVLHLPCRRQSTTGNAWPSVLHTEVHALLDLPPLTE